jgi:hypothetical protein
MWSGMSMVSFSSLQLSADEGIYQVLSDFGARELNLSAYQPGRAQESF